MSKVINMSYDLKNMMMIATRLGVIACRYLVNSYYEDRYVSAPEIAEYYNMNVRALMPALRQLTRAGILRSRVGGLNPGFIFAKDPSQLMLYQILNVLEGDPSFECCRELIPGLKCDCGDKTKCEVFLLFNGVIDSTVEVLKTTTIADFDQELS